MEKSGGKIATEPEADGPFCTYKGGDLTGLQGVTCDVVGSAAAVFLCISMRVGRGSFHLLCYPHYLMEGLSA